MIYSVVFQDLLWLVAAVALRDLVVMGVFGWKRRDRMIGWLTALCCYIVIEILLHKPMEAAAAWIWMKVTR